jgi:hypothetical protein
VIQQSAAHTFSPLAQRIAGAGYPAQSARLRLAAYAALAMKLVGKTDSRHYL